jgi:hypothetical protein
MFKILSVLFIAFTLSLSLSNASYAAKGIYQTPKDFINKAFLGETPYAKVLWLSTEDKATIAEILQHKYNRMRIRYWQLNDQTVWVLDEIGKEKPITIGVHIKQKKINHFKVLTFRESRGYEVRHDFYAKQFINAQLNEEIQLSQHIDGITGATMSVRATTKVARIALWLDAKVTRDSL